MVEDPIKDVERNLFRAITLEDSRTTSLSLKSQMKHLMVPGVSIAVINDGEIAWAKGYGVEDAATGKPVTPETLFQACSISKAVTGLGVMKLVEIGLLNLDDDVNDYLRSWQVPENELTKGEKVTLRRLLTHRAGLGIVGMKGHQRGSPFPNILQILDGLPPSITGPVRVFMEPGSRFFYSGGGYSVIQLLMMEVTGKPFAELMRELVLDPCEMTYSTFEQPLPSNLWQYAAAGYDVDGQKIQGDWQVFPASAAAGLWTTPSDIARFAIGIQKAVQGLSNTLLSQEMARMMTSPQYDHWGLGPEIGGKGSNRYFYHSGGNEGFRCEMVSFCSRGQGAVVMTNSDNGTDLAMQVIRGVAHTYGWSHFKTQMKTPAALDAEMKVLIAGRYQSIENPQVQAWVTVEEDQAWIEVPNLFPPKFRIYPEVKHSFFDVENGHRFIFSQQDCDVICEAHMFNQVLYSKKVN